MKPSGCQIDPYHDADNQKGKDTAVPAQKVQSRVYGTVAPYLASVRVQELQKVRRSRRMCLSATVPWLV